MEKGLPNATTINQTEELMQNEGHLFDVLERTRKGIVNAILKSGGWPSGSPSLGPVLIFLEDPSTGCLYNWSKVTWNQLKLGWLLRDALTDTKHIILEIKPLLIDNNLLYKFSKNDVSIDDFVQTLDNFLNRNLSEFDNFLDEVASEKINKFLENKITKDLKIIIPLIEKISEHTMTNKGIYLSRYRIEPRNIPEFIEELVKINRGRLNAFQTLREKLKHCEPTEECRSGNKERCGGICEYIINHPRYKDNKIIQEKILNEWKDFVKLITFTSYADLLNDFKKNKIETEKLMDKAIEIFNDLPQEVNASDAFNSLKTINSTAYKSRSDTENIRLSDIIYFPTTDGKPMFMYANKDVDKWPLYRYTHYFERLYYGSPPMQLTGQKAIIKNILFVPIKFFEAQVRGQIVVILTNSINVKNCVDAIEMSYHKIQEAAKYDFYGEILKRSYNAEITKPFSVIVGECLPKLFLLEGAVIWDGDIQLIGWRQKDPTFSNWDIDHTQLKLYNKNELEKERKNIENEIINTKILKKAKDWFNLSAQRKELLYEVVSITENTDNSTEDYSFNIFKNQKEIKSCIRICIPIARRVIGFILYFKEDIDVIRVSAREMTERITDSIVYKKTADLARMDLMRKFSAEDAHAHASLKFANYKLEGFLKLSNSAESNSKIRAFMPYLYSALKAEQELNELKIKILKTPDYLIPLDQIISTIINSEKTLAYEKNVDVQFNNNNLSLSVKCSPEAAERIFDLLIQNAIEAFDNIKDIRKRVVRIEFQRKFDQDLVIISDNANGLPSDVKKGIWETHIDKSHKKDPIDPNRIRGFGLSLVGQLISYLGWQIVVASEKGKGTKFTIKTQDQL